MMINGNFSVVSNVNNANMNYNVNEDIVSALPVQTVNKSSTHPKSKFDKFDRLMTDLKNSKLFPNSDIKNSKIMQNMQTENAANKLLMM